MIRTFNTPGSVWSSSSARSIGRTVPAIGDTASIGRGGVRGGALKGFADTISYGLGSLGGMLPTRGAKFRRCEQTDVGSLEVGACQYFTCRSFSQANTQAPATDTP